jgi:hypothetical protein
MPAHHTLDASLDAYLDAAGIRDRGKSPLFRSAVWHSGTLTENAMHRIDAYRMIQRRAAAMGLKVRIHCHTFRATGITASMDAGGTLEKAQRMAAHESPRTTKLYDRTGDAIPLDEVERMRIEGTESTTAASHAVRPPPLGGPSPAGWPRASWTRASRPSAPAGPARHTAPARRCTWRR